MQLSNDQRIIKDKNLSKFAMGIYKNKRCYLPENAVCFLRSDPAKNGFYAEAYLQNKQIIIAIRGTEPTKFNDLWTDLQMAVGKIPEQFTNAIEFYNKVLKYCKENNTNEKNIVLTGHSLGGSLVELLAYFTGNEAVAFNPYGVQNLLNHQTFLRLDKVKYNNNIRVYGNLNDAVFCMNINNQIGTIYVTIINTDKTKLKLLTYHGIEVMGDLKDFRLLNPAVDKKYLRKCNQILKITHI